MFPRLRFGLPWSAEVALFNQSRKKRPGTGEAAVKNPDELTTRDSLGHEESQLSHLMPVSLLLAVFAALIVLTVLTVAVSYFDFGAVNLLVALGVATVKATLVALYFMHLLYDKPFNLIVFVIGIAFLGLFLAITMLDTVEYHPQVQAWEEKAR